MDKRLSGRDELITRMKHEMLGPGSELCGVDLDQEIISGSPLQRYCVGILYPQKNTLDLEDDDLEGINKSDKEEQINEEEKVEKNLIKTENDKKGSFMADSEDSMDENVSMATKLLPSSMGFTFISKKKLTRIKVESSFATYRKAIVPDCKIRIPEKLSEGFSVPEVFSTYFTYDVETRILQLVSSFEKKQIHYWYENDQADDGTFKNYAYKMLELLKSGYVREPKKYVSEVCFDKSDYFKGDEYFNDTEVSVSALRHKLVGGFYSYTLMLVNHATGKATPKNTIFQPEMIVTTDDNEELIFSDYDDMNLSKDYDEEEASNSLLYRKHKKYGTGLGVSVNWDIKDGKGCIWTDFFPQVEVPQMEFSVDDKYDVDNDVFSMKYLSDLDDADSKHKLKKLQSLASGYKAWIEEIEEESKKLDKQYTDAARRHITNCYFCVERIRKGIELLETNPLAWNAFELANRAMYMQRVHVGVQAKFEESYPDNEELGDILDQMDYYEEPDVHKWRPFQLAFLLMSIPSMVDDSLENEERNLVDLIWFPTGGGKTEAYLGLTAFTIFYRRLAYKETSSGTTVIMRYTLRLLAAQQFTRASTLICACEFIRQEGKQKRSTYPKYDLGDEEISIGLWIGGSHTPNKNKEAKACYEELAKATNKNLSYVKDQHNKFQVLKCPWCGTKLVRDVNSENKLIGRWGYHMVAGKSFEMSCTHDDCVFSNKLPLQVVDEELYKNPPTLLFATVDKFAMLPWYQETGSFFAVDTDNRAPELIIQDELHLISGPLGSMVGLYETAIDYLCSKKGVSPKIIASTATICRAKEQCSSLYNREVFQFPPQGIDEADSFFARAAKPEEKNGRMYVGLMPSGKTKAMMESRILASLLQIVKESDWDDEVKDAFWTLTTYFNSLKELGKCSTIVQNDVRDNIERMAHRNLYAGGKRIILSADELTSRVSTTELNQTLNKLEKIKYSKENWDNKIYAVNLLLATNMISVGIDVDRLNVMVLLGQPKLTSEYIQASSRVGRKYPGVVFTQYDGARSRDRSHYEQFKSYHESFYRYVEPTGVTPFSEPARKRALHAVIVSLLRHNHFPSDEDISMFKKDENIELLETITSYITDRMEAINSRLSYEIEDETENVKNEIDIIYDKIDFLAEQTEHQYLEYGNIIGRRRPEYKRIMKPYGIDEEELYTFNTMTSMRNVESTVNVNVVILEGEDENEEAY